MQHTSWIIFHGMRNTKDFVRKTATREKTPTHLSRPNGKTIFSASVVEVISEDILRYRQTPSEQRLRPMLMQRSAQQLQRLPSSNRTRGKGPSSMVGQLFTKRSRPSWSGASALQTHALRITDSRPQNTACASCQCSDERCSSCDCRGNKSATVTGHPS